MTRVTFDTLEYVRRLQEAGVERQTAEAHADLLRDMLWADVAKTEDLDRLEAGLKEDMERLETGLKNDLDHKLQELELRMTIKLGGMLAVMAGLIVTAQKLL